MRFTRQGLALESGRTLDADIIVTATGLDLVFLGEIEVVVDGRVLQGPDTLVYKGCMFDGVPNLAYAFGYTNASWTLKVDLTARYLTRLFHHMDRSGASVATPVQADPTVRPAEASGLQAGYVRRAVAVLPKQGSKRPWRLQDNYILDLFDLTFGRIADGVIQFGRHPVPSPRPSGGRILGAEPRAPDRPLS